jgi:catechol 2,3-dioxygenase-like lactoylglutathione lyase family enzyme
MADTQTTSTPWPGGVAVAQVCFTRPTRDLARLLRFYRDAIGLPVLYQFGEAEDPAGAMLGLPGTPYHLELLKVPDAESAPPSKHNVTVLHIPDREQRDALAARLRDHGFEPTQPANPWWLERGIVFEDPDGWPLVLSYGAGLGA